MDKLPIAIDEEILTQIDDVFAECQRPEHFVDLPQGLEGADHDQLLRSRDKTTLSLGDVGNVGYDPLCFINPAGFAYFFPALARLALIESSRTHDWYATQFLFHLTCQGRENRFLIAFTPQQRRVVCRFVEYLVESRAGWADESFCSDELLTAIELWSSKA